MEKECNHEDPGGNEVKSVYSYQCYRTGCDQEEDILLEKFILLVAEKSPAEKNKVCLRDKGSNTCPVVGARSPGLGHSTHLELHDDEWEGMDERWNDCLKQVTDGGKK